MASYFIRIINNKLKLSIIIFIFMLPVLDIVMTLIDIHNGASALNPMIAAFLGNTIFMGLQKLLLWYLPLFLAIIVSDDCIEDFRLGYKNLLISKLGKKRYYFLNIIKSFVLSFFILLIPLIFNLLMTQIAFSGGTYNLYLTEDIEKISALKNAFQHPLMTNLVYILLASFISGVLGMGSTAIAISFPNRFIVYPVVFVLWYIPSLFNPSIINAFQPFTEYTLADVMHIIMLVFSINLASVLFGFVKVIRYDQV